jgi:hypothetical protein
MMTKQEMTSQRDKNREKLYNSTVGFFHKPMHAAAWYLDATFVKPFRDLKNEEGTKSDRFTNLVWFAMFPFLWVACGVLLSVGSFMFYSIKSLLTLGWHGLNCLASELCSDNPFASDMGRSYL